MHIADVPASDEYLTPALAAASIAHEVSQPLTGILTNASICVWMLDANPPNIDTAREAATRLLRDGTHASDVIARLRALFSRQELLRQSVDLMHRLFDAFYTTKGGGIGIGLAVSRSIVERHQGHLWAEPNDGPGATFFFSIPCTPELQTRFS
jgi:signal transduction histidine kinase